MRSWKYYEVLIKRFRDSPQSILGIGAGIAPFVEACQHQKLQGFGIELEPGEETTQSILAHDFKRPVTSLDDAAFEAVYCESIETLDAVAQDNLLRDAHRLLKPNGQILVVSPCRHFEPARKNPANINLLTPSELQAKLESLGFSDCNLGYNSPQKVPEIPDNQLAEIWDQYHPDLLSKNATVLARKKDPRQSRSVSDADLEPSRPIFIGGTGRSGTTLVVRLLDQHPSIATIKWESHFMVDNLGLPAVVDRGAEALADFLDHFRNQWWRRRVENLKRKPYYAGLCDDLPREPSWAIVDQFELDIRQARKKADRLRISQRFVSELMSLFLKSRGKSRWAEKTPKNALMSDFLLELFPNARIINCIRDGRDVAASMVDRQIWPIQANPKTPRIKRGATITVEDAAIFWATHLEHMLHLTGVYPSACYDLRLESLIENPAEEMSSLSEFLDEPFCDSWLEYDIKSDSVGRWQNSFSEEDKSAFKTHAGELLIRLGYVKDDNW